MQNRRFPAEWETQSAVLLVWPHQDTDWGANLAQVESVYSALCQQITRFEPVLMVCRDADHQQHIEKRLLPSQYPVHFAHADYNDTWARDFGPITVLDDNSPLLLDFQFNAWGNKFVADKDNLITQTLERQHCWHAPRKVMDFILEGGSIDTDGAGTLLTTSQCLLSPERNNQLDREGIEQLLIQALGLNRVLWLEHGYLLGDDTDSHIDTLARFCNPSTICYVSCDDPTDVHYEPLKQMEAELKSLTQADGTPYQLYPLPWPGAKKSADGKRLPASYANFLIINGAVIAPSYRDDKDEQCRQVLSACFPEREIIMLDALPLIQQYGSIHCISMQLPQAVFTP